MKLFVSVFLFCVVPLIESRSVGGRETDTCIADYLKSKGLIGDEFGSTRPLHPFCETIVEVTKNHVMQSVYLEVATDKDMRNEADCVIETLKQSDFSNNLLAIYVYETADNVDAEKLKETKGKITRATFKSFMKCQASKKFGQIFDSLLEPESTSEEETDPKEDYCIRKHIIDNQLLKTDRYKLKMNPQNLDTTTIDCAVLYQKALKDAEDELVQALLEEDSSESDQNSKLTPSDANCILNVIREGNYIDQMLHFDYIKEFNLNDASKNELRGRFVDVMSRLAEDSSKCFL